MSLLPQTMQPPDSPLGQVGPGGVVLISQNWWLLIYNLVNRAIGTNQAGLPADALQDLADADTTAADADAIALRAPLDAIAMLAQDDVLGDPVDLSGALLLAQDALLQDPAPQAPPMAAITVAVSPFTYTAPAAGHVTVTGGTVSAIALVRQGTSVATGLTAGLIPVCRNDQVTVTYTVAPTMTFIPWSSP